MDDANNKSTRREEGGSNSLNSDLCMRIGVTDKGVVISNLDEIASFSDRTKANVKPPYQKIRRRKEEGYLQDVYLPPCRICADVSSGFHYGANTCEACKGFFRRSLKKENKIYRCKCTATEKDIHTDGPIVNGCAACRYKRCLQIGMSKEAIKIGRYTSEHRTQNITQIKSMEAGSSRVEDKFEISKESDTSSPRFIVDSSYLGLSSPEEHLKFASHPPSTNEPVCYSIEDIHEKTSRGLSVTEIEEMINIIYEAHNDTLFKKATQPKDDIEKNHKEHLEMLKMKKEMFGNMKPLTKKEYLEFYNTTGIDIDGRQKNFQLFIEEFQNKIRKVIRFSKSIPGFKELSQSDQIKLIKHSRAEVFVITGFRNISKFVNLKLGTITMPWDKVMHKGEGQNIFPWELTQKKFEYSNRIGRLGINDKEQALLRAIVMTFTVSSWKDTNRYKDVNNSNKYLNGQDRCDLSDPERVEAIQEKLIICFEHLVKSRLPSSRNFMYKVFDTLISLRDLTEIDNRITKNLLFEYQTPENLGWPENVIL